MILSAANLRRLLVVSCLLLAPHFALAAEEARKLLTVVDYIGGDYKNAVQAGKVIHLEEYREMKEFSQRSLELSKQLDAGTKGDIEQSVKKLAALIDRQADEKAVAALSREIKEKLIRTYKIVTYPRTLPSLQAGKTVFMRTAPNVTAKKAKATGRAARR